tara:strand:- start:15 stop:218 length:204 start_codon:yes stop_codon:yes gene_type:complete
MTPKEKAKELVDKYEPKGIYINNIECALICVDEIINTGVNQDYIMQNGYYLSLVEFYTEVKKEINKL